MTGNEIIAFFNKLIDDSIDDDFALDLANNSKDQREAEMSLKILEAKNSDKKTTVGGTYETEIDLADDFSVDKRIMVDTREVVPVPFDDQIRYKDDGSKYFIDYGSGKLHLCGTITEVKTIHQLYIKFSPALTTSTEPLWPDRFHRIIPFDMADLYFAGLDTDAINRAMAPRQAQQAEMLRRGMLLWDSKLKIRSINGSVSSRRGRDLPSNVAF